MSTATMRLGMNARTWFTIVLTVVRWTVSAAMRMTMSRRYHFTTPATSPEVSVLICARRRKPVTPTRSAIASTLIARRPRRTRPARAPVMIQPSTRTMSAPRMTGIAALLSAIPVILGALIVLVLGWIITGALAGLVRRGLRAIKVDAMAERVGVTGFLRRAQIKTDTSGLVAGVVKWYLRLIVILMAADTVHLTTVSTIVNQVLAFIPSLIVAVLILGAFSWLASRARAGGALLERTPGRADRGAWPDPAARLAPHQITGRCAAGRHIGLPAAQPNASWNSVILESGPFAR